MSSPFHQDMHGATAASLLQSLLPFPSHAGPLAPGFTPHSMDLSCTEVSPQQVPGTVAHTSATSASQCTQVFFHIIKEKEKTTLLLSYGLNIQLIFGT